MLIYLGSLYMAYSFNVTSFPEGGSPPLPTIASAAVYDSINNCIITIGGQQLGTNVLTSQVNIYNLTSNTWKSPQINSEYSPTSLVNHRMYLRADRKCIILGKHSEVFLFDIDNYFWSKDELKGSQLNGVETFGFDSFTYRDHNYVAIYGGIIADTYVDGLYLIDVDTLVCTKLSNGPSPRMGASLTFYNNSLYIYGYSYSNINSNTETGDELYKYDLDLKTWSIVKTSGTSPGMSVNHYAYVHNHELFIIYGIIPETSTEHQSIFKFSFKSQSWSLLNNIPSSGRIFSAELKIGSKVYLCYGKNSTKTTNAIIYLDLNQESPTHTIVSKDWVSPLTRVFHSSFKVNQLLYVFAGSNGDNTGNEKFYNDMWYFDLVNEKWKLVYPTGDLPSPRKSVAGTVISGNIFTTFGGKGFDGYLNDFYWFHQGMAKWFVVEVSGEKPEFRSNACIVFVESFFFIVGGKNGEKGFGDVWIFDIVLNKYIPTEARFRTSQVPAIYDINDAFCYAKQDSNYNFLYIAGGTNYIGYPNLGILEIKFDLNNKPVDYQFSRLGDIHQLTILGSETSIIKSNQYLIRISGAALSKLILPNILIIDTETNEIKLIKTNKTLDLYGHSAVHFKDSIYIFGGIGANEIYKSSDKTNKNLIKLKFGDEDRFKLDCSDGTKRGSCEPCIQGTYSKNGTCLECPQGKFNNLMYSNSPELCLPCPRGYFSNQLGARMCLQCSSGYECSIGSKKPLKSYSLPLNFTMQPGKLEDQKDFISKVTTRTWIIASFLIMGIIIISIIFNPFLSKLQLIDLFTESHKQELGKNVVYKKTSIGGIFSLFFILVGGVLVLSGFLNYYLDNVTEIKALIPLISLDEEIHADSVNITSTFYFYGGECLINDKCNPLISFDAFGFEYFSYSFSCLYESDHCLIHLSYEKFRLTEQNAEIYIKIKDKSGYSSGVSVNISSSSSIPHEISSIFIVFDTNSKDKLFKGPEPSIFYFKFIPSVFYSESTQWPDLLTGFHISQNSNPVAGSTATQDTLNVQITLNLKIVISESETAMQTKRIVNQKMIVFFATIVGSVFGIMGSFAGIMNFFEGILVSLNRKIKEKQRVKRIINDRISIKEVFSPYVLVSNQTKISPLKYQIRDTMG